MYCPKLARDDGFALQLAAPFHLPCIQLRLPALADTAAAPTAVQVCPLALDPSCSVRSVLPLLPLPGFSSVKNPRPALSFSVAGARAVFQLLGRDARRVDLHELVGAVVQCGGAAVALQRKGAAQAGEGVGVAAVLALHAIQHMQRKRLAAPS